MSLSDRLSTTIAAVVLVAVCLLRTADGQSTSCHSEFMRGNSNVAQTSKAPYQIVLAENATTSRIRVMLVAPTANDYFVGFLVEGRVRDNVDGAFVRVPQETRTVDCNGALVSDSDHRGRGMKKRGSFFERCKILTLSRTISR